MSKKNSARRHYHTRQQTGTYHNVELPPSPQAYDSADVIADDDPEHIAQPLPLITETDDDNLITDADIDREELENEAIGQFLTICISFIALVAVLAIIGCIQHFFHLF